VDFDKHIPTFERVAISFEITDTKAEEPELPEELSEETLEEPPREITPDTPLFGWHNIKP
jgi:hypothetical protein